MSLRLQCSTSVIATLALAASAPLWGQRQLIGDWHVLTNTDSFTGQRTVTYGTTPKDAASDADAAHWPLLAVMSCAACKDATHLGVMFNAPVPLFPNTQTEDGVTETEIEFRVDNGDVESGEWILGDNSSDAICRTPIDFVRKLASAKVLHFRYETFRGDVVTIDLPVSGLPTAALTRKNGGVDRPSR